MKERPILFSGPMVRAILDGRKTQTRRVVKTQPGPSCARWPCACPYGAPGDHLYVRETWAAPHACDHLKPSEIPPGTRLHFAAREERGGLLWRPSIFLPRWASRITLAVTAVRVERLQEISEADAIAEGAQWFGDLPSTHPYGRDARWSMESPTSTKQCVGSARMALANLWNKINGADAWDINPWVWVVEFRRVQP